MKKFLNLYSIAAISSALLCFALSGIDAKCNVCTEYGIACVNETAFNVCIDNNKPDPTEIHVCPDNKICTASSLKCVERNTGMKPYCDMENGCGKCDDTKIFACISRTDFAQCNGSTLTNIRGKCPPGTICDSSKPEICSEICGDDLTELECDREEPAN